MGPKRVLVESFPFLTPLLAGLLIAIAVAGLGVYASRTLRRSKQEAARILEEARQDAENQKNELLVSTQEKVLALEAETDERERELESREAKLEALTRQCDHDRTSLSKRQRELEKRAEELARRERSVRDAEKAAQDSRDEARRTLEQIAGLSAEEARAQMIAGVEENARREAARLARKIEDEARDNAEREALNLMMRAAERMNLGEAVETTVTFIKLPNDEMKGRIIGREGRNIRALEMATGIDLIVDDTPEAILISCFDPIRREIARVAIERLVEDGRIHPARIEEVVARVRDEIETLVEEEGNQAAFSLGISDYHPRLARLVGKMKYFTNHGQNLLQHCTEVALLAGHMAAEVGARVALGHRAGLLHEIGRVDDSIGGHTLLASAELAAKYGESAEVVEAIQSLHPDVAPNSLEAILLNTANRLSNNRPGARKENLAIFVERLRRLEALASKFPGVNRAYAVKAGKEIRVIVDSDLVSDDKVYNLSKEIARAIEKQLTYPGQIKISVVRETRAVRFAV